MTVRATVTNHDDSKDDDDSDGDDDSVDNICLLCEIGKRKNSMTMIFHPFYFTQNTFIFMTIGRTKKWGKMAGRERR